MVTSWGVPTRIAKLHGATGTFNGRLVAIDGDGFIPDDFGGSGGSVLEEVWQK